MRIVLRLTPDGDAMIANVPAGSEAGRTVIAEICFSNSDDDADPLDVVGTLVLRAKEEKEDRLQ